MDASAASHIAFLRGLRAVRQFRPDSIPDAVVDDILDVARWSGSANNRQHWELVVVRDGATLAELAAADGYAKHLAAAPLGIVLAMAGELFDQETYDEGRLSERIMLAAWAHGVGSSIGWFEGRGPDQVKELLGIPRERLVRTAISFGYPDLAARRTRQRQTQPRKPLSQIVYRERFG